MHGGFYHLISNMWCLYLFGRSVEDRMGRVSFLAFYLLCGLAANLCWVYLNQCSQNPALGASGAISGVMAAYVVFFPGAQVKVWMGWMIGKIKVPAILVMLIFYVLNAVPAWVVATTGSGGQVAYAAHVGGFLAGLVLCKVFETRHTAPEMLVSDGERWK
jgi:membrane associated rhomboid family serine protease